jgi:hypothetical protein
MKKALTQVGAFLVNHIAVRFEQEWLGGSMTGIISKSMAKRGQYAPK